jgi:hypothetical protein
VRTARTLASAALALAAGGCLTFIEVPVETPIRPKIDASPFSRVYVAGFLPSGSEDVDANLETVRLLRSQLKNKGGMRIIEADVLPLVEAAKPVPEQGDAATAPAAAPQGDGARAAAVIPEVDLPVYEKLFDNKDYWKKVGEEYGNPLIITGSVAFVPHQRSGYVQKEQEVYDSFGRRSVVPVRTYMDRKGYILRPKFVFIDGRTGETLYTETFREEILYNAEQSTPALSSYFELMDRLLPSFLSTLSSQTIRGTRVLLK